MSDQRFIACALMLLAACVHAGMAAVHGGLLGLGFVAAAGAQTAWTIAAVQGAGDARLRHAGLVLNAAILSAYALSRTVGLPGAAPEPVMGLDALTALAEITCCALLAGRVPRYAEGAGLTAGAALLCLMVSGMAVHG